MGVLSGYKPEKVWSYFEEISSIPRGSGNTDAIAEFCAGFAKERGLDWYRDDANNVLIRKAASKGCEEADAVILQGHTDMVCEKREDVEFDFLKEGIRLKVDGDILRAEGTTLGGDNGIAVAMMLAILDDDTLIHPAIEVLLTSDEETGMVGAFAFDPSRLTGHRLINLDSEYEGVLMCSCAGGMDAVSEVPVEREAMNLTTVALEISGLKSGHSGVEIDKGRADANMLMARLLKALKETDYRLISLEGGVRPTAIAPIAKAVIGVDGSKAAEVKQIVSRCGSIFCKEFATAEPDMKVSAEAGEKSAVNALTAESTRLVWKVLLPLPDSVQSMSIDMPNLVQTSTNLGIMRLEEDKLTFCNTIRSSMTTQKHMVFDQIAAIVSLAGGITCAEGEYPGWAYNPDSVLKDAILAAYKRITGKDASVEAVHAGIECGLFADSIENLDCVSIGPEMGDVHTPNEWLSISSSERTYELLTAVLEEISK